GYSTCHWCHVMERESFEDPEVATLLNAHFVAVKVDREERPDIDHLYMNVCQLLTGQGGWPLTVILTPEKKPFFAGTYFPKTGQYGRPGLLTLLQNIHAEWQHHRAAIRQTSDEILTAIRQPPPAGRDELDEKTLRHGYVALKDRFDPVYGGFGQAPKFPVPHHLLYLLQYRQQYPEASDSLPMVDKTLQAMYAGGIYDHLGFGFSRYATDREWLVPHFEKMLYDNALLAIAYLEGYAATGRPLYARVAREIFTYVLRDMTSPEGGFYSAEDADSEGEEGKFYVWTPGEIKAVLGQESGERFCRWFNVTEKGNFAGANILNRIGALDPETPPDAAVTREPAAARERLFSVREKRVHPHKDDKILTAWNGLMIAALAAGARILAEPAYLEAAKAGLTFIRQKLQTADGRLLARYRDGEAAFLGYLDDYAFLIWALLEVYQASGEKAHLTLATKLQTRQDNLFWDQAGGGYYFSGEDAEELPARTKEAYDGAYPAGNSVAARNLLRLARLTGDPAFTARAHNLFQHFAGQVNLYPAGYTHLLTAFLLTLPPAHPE
ncbi:MAG: thioredoxin domain-containing protein, partial [Heliobacteriaceae bacterium]|nr:thioredoxin domain-containing protein [Heliobacteriaceae bacterium]